MVAGQRVASAAIGKVGNAAVRVGQETARAGSAAGQKFGRGMAGGARQSGTEFRRVVDQAAQYAQRRLSSIRPTPIRMPAVQQAAVPAAGRAAGGRSGGFAGMPRATPALPAGAFTDAGGRLRDSRGRYTAGGPRTGAGAAPGTVPAGGGVAGGVGGDAGLSRLWSLSALGGQLRGVSDRAIQISDESVDVASGRQIARAEMRTVVPDAGERGGVREAARESALGRGGMVVAIDESSFTAAVFRGVASGLQTERAVELVPVSADLALAGQTTPEQAQIGLTDTGSVFKERSFREMGDVFARGQDIGTFLNIGELFSAVTKMASTAKASGVSFEETVAIASTLSRQGPTFRGATGGQKGLMAVREMELGAMEKLGMRTRRDASGGLDFSANIGALAAVDASVAQINKAFGKRAAPAVLALMADVQKLDSTILDLQDTQGTAADNAREHSDIWRSTLQQNQAAIDVFAADVGEGAMIVREAGLVAKGTLARLFAGIPGAGQVAGAALEVGGRAGQLGVGALDAMVGVHALKQLAHGTLNPANLFRSESTVSARRQARGDQRGMRGAQRGMRGLFGTVTRGVGRSRGGFASMFRVIRGGAVRLGAVVAAELAGALAGRVVAGGALPAAKAAVTAGTAAVAGGGGAAAGGLATALKGATLAVAPFAAAVGVAAVLLGGVGLALRGLSRSDTGIGRWMRERQMNREEPTGLWARLDEWTRSLVLGKDWELGKPDEVADNVVGTPGVRSKEQSQAWFFGTGDAAVDQAVDTAQRLRDLMPGSDAKEGPLSDLTAAGMAIPATLAAGVTEGSPVLTAAVWEMLAGIGLPALAAPDAMAPPEMLAPTAPDMPQLVPPAAVDAPALLALDVPGVPAMALPDMLAPDAPIQTDALTLDPLAAPLVPPLLAPAALVPDVPALEPPVVIPSFAEPPDAPGGSLTRENQAVEGPAVGLEAAILAAVAVQQQLLRVTMQSVEEMRRERRHKGRRPADPDHETMPGDVQDFDVQGDLLAGYGP